MDFFSRGVCLFAILSITTPCLAQKTQTVNLMYLERPPYATGHEGNKPHGLLIDPVEQAFQEAGIPYRLVEVPAVRQLAILKSNKDFDCGLGWFKRDERASYAKYSKPFFQDLPTVGIVSSTSTYPAAAKLKEFFLTPKLTWTVIEGYSYGPYVDDLMKEHKASVQTMNGNFNNLVNMIDKNHASITFLARQEAQYYVDQAQYKDRLRIIDFSDVPAGEARYLLCSLKVDDALLEKINKSFQKIHFTLRK
jgi:uncharacterized protein (TIGR02285 family)